MDLETHGAPPPGEPREVELKLELEPSSAAVLLDHPLLKSRLGEERQTVSTYFDTGSDALRRAGLSLRVRRTDGSYVQTMKAAPRTSAGLFDRWEWEEPIAGPEPDLERFAGIGPLSRIDTGTALRPLFTTEVGRRSGVIEHRGARIEVVIDRGEVLAGKSRQPLLELELELLEGSPEALFEVARALRNAVPLRIGVLTKSERGQRLLGGRDGRAGKAEPVTLAPEVTAKEAFRTIAFACLRHFRSNEPLVIAGRNADALHQSRVALRRLRSALSLFRPILQEAERRRFQDALRHLAGVLGEARNLDVLLDRRGEALPAPTRDALSRRREETYDHAIDALHSAAAQGLMIDLSEWIALDRFVRAKGRAVSRRIAPFSASVLERYWRKMERRAAALASGDDDMRHELRIAGKKLRYASEFFASLYPRAESRDRFIHGLEKLQDALGDLNDLATERTLRADLEARGIELAPERGKSGEARLRKSAISAAERAFQTLSDAGPFWR